MEVANKKSDDTEKTEKKEEKTYQQGRIKPGSLVVLSGFGAGLAWGTAVLRW